MNNTDREILEKIDNEIFSLAYPVVRKYLREGNKDAASIFVKNLPESKAKDKLYDHVFSGYNCAIINIRVGVNSFQCDKHHVSFMVDGQINMVLSAATEDEILDMATHIAQNHKGIYVNNGMILANFTGKKLGFVYRYDKNEWLRVVDGGFVLVQNSVNATIFELPIPSNISSYKFRNGLNLMAASNI